MLTLRHLISEEDCLYKVVPGEEKIVRYYAHAISHLLEPLELGSGI